MIYTEDIQERFILLGVATSDSDDTIASLDELAQLVDTAGAETIDIIVQNREKIHPVTYLGKGKIEEVRERVYDTAATGVVCDDELSPVQLRNLEDLLETKIVDRTMVILDIFAKRANTSEGKVQVELAQLKFAAARLVGMRASLSRLGGGIGTRGPGEKKIEMDRRLIHDRISQLKAELRGVEKQRDIRRKGRKETPVAAIVGYTNAGKSTLLNTLTDADILAEDKLFATLDPTTRRLKLSGGQEVLFTDTVGFIRKLPHHLIEAFKSTLEEAKYADIIIHVVDVSSPDADAHMLVVYDTLKSLGVEDKEIITVFNKCDRLTEQDILPRDFHADYTCKLSAKSGEGIAEFKELIEKILRSRRIYIDKVIDYKSAGKIAQIRKYGELVSEEYTEEGVHIIAWIPSNIYDSIMA